jgi:hypothetical protein
MVAGVLRAAADAYQLRAEEQMQAEPQEHARAAWSDFF